jgi:hypothetical protein
MESDMKLEELETKIQRLEDIEAIKKLQSAYGYYLEHWDGQQIVDLFSNSPDASMDAGRGAYVGQERIREFFIRGGMGSDFLHVMMQIAGIVDVDPDGKTAKGRWYGFGCLAVPEERKVSAVWSVGCYENEYVKEDGKWKFKKVLWNSIFRTPYEDGWVKTPKVEVDFSNKSWGAPSSRDKSYPSGYQFPYHYKNPVTGK